MTNTEHKNPSCVMGYHFCSPSAQCRDCDRAELRKLRADSAQLQFALEQSEDAFEKQKKYNGALEIAIQEAHRDTDAALLQINEIREILDPSQWDKLHPASKKLELIREILAQKPKCSCPDHDKGGCTSLCPCALKRKSVRERAEELGIDVSKIKTQDPHPPGPYPEEGGIEIKRKCTCGCHAGGSGSNTACGCCYYPG